MPPLGPLRFEPIFRRYVWGGHRLAQLLGKPTGQEPCAESWEICDRGTDQTRVASGPWREKTLGDLVAEFGPELLGRHDSQPQPRRRFPLLLKFLDARERLSVQVHPDDARAARLDPPDSGKTEAWYVIEAQPGSRIYAGLRPGVDRRRLAEAIAGGTCEACLETLEPQPGDCLLLPAGTVHALGGGLVIAELQQPSDVTYRLFDWNRLGTDGRPRPLHIDQGLEAIDFSLAPPRPRPTAPIPSVASNNPRPERLATCPHFVWDRWVLSGRQSTPVMLGGDDRFHVLAVVAGQLQIAGDPNPAPLPPGGTALLPASLGPVSVTATGPTVVLDAYLP